MRRIQSYLRQNALACVAIFIALGGVSYAAALPRDSVGSQQIKKNAVTSEKVKNGSLKALDFRRRVGAAPRAKAPSDRRATAERKVSGPWADGSRRSCYRNGGRRAFGQLSQSGPSRGRSGDMSTG